MAVIESSLSPGESRGSLSSFKNNMVVAARPFTTTNNNNKNKAPLWRRPLLLGGGHSPPLHHLPLENVAVVLAPTWSKHRRKGKRNRILVLCLAVATSIGLGGLTAGALLVLGIDGWCWQEWCGYNDASTELWSYYRINRILQCDSQSIVRQAEDRARHLMDRAKQELWNRNGTVYGTIESPLFGFFIPKTGSNTQEYYHLTALAAVRQSSYTGCSGGERFMYECMKHDIHHMHQLCYAARGFGNHFHPDLLLDQLLHANCSQIHNNDKNNNNEPPMSDESHTIHHSPNPNHNTGQRGYHHRWSNPTALSHQAVLRDHSVCTIVFRDPIERLVSGFYEWQHQITTPLTAREYLDVHGPHNFPPVEPMAHWVRPKPPERYPSSAALSGRANSNNNMLLEAVFESCLVGVTEQMHQYVTTLSRVLWISAPPPPPPQQSPEPNQQSGNQSDNVANPSNTTTTTTTATTTTTTTTVIRARSRERLGLDESDIAELRQRLAPLFREEAALWHLAQRVSQAQSKVAQSFPSLLPPHKAPIRPSRRSPFNFDCLTGCERCTPPGWERLRWTAYQSLLSADSPPASDSGNDTRNDDYNDDGCVWPGAWLRNAEGNKVRCCAHADGN